MIRSPDDGPAMPEQDTILIVDDDELLRHLIKETLLIEGFQVLEAENGESVDAILDAHAVNLIILDISLPGADGFAVMRDLRRSSEIPVIMLTAKSDVVDRVVGLELGADDYICKPVEMRELIARVRTVLRRQRSPNGQQEADERTGVRIFNDFVLDIGRRQLVSDNGSEIQLTSGEFDLLQVFTEQPNRTLNRDQLLDMTRSRDWNPFDRSIDVLIGRLRKKIEADPCNPRIIKTVRGVGYIFATEVARN